MKNIRTKLFLLSALTAIVFAFNFKHEISAQVVRDNRVVIPAPTPTPSPKTQPTSSPQPTTTPSPSPKQTMSDLQAKIRQVLFRPELRRGSIGVKIISLDTGKTVFEQDAEKYFMPASNMKSFTVATAMERLTPNFRFVTSVYAGAMPDASGTIKGDLTVFGRGDISISTAFYDGDYFKGIDELANRIAQAGVKRVEGNLIGDETFFSGNPIPPGWEWDDLDEAFGAEVSSLPINDNAVDISVKPGIRNSPCAVQILPANTIYKVVNRCVTTNSGGDLRVVKKLSQNILEVYGSIAPGGKGLTDSIAISHPAELFVELLRQQLLQKGITVTGKNLVKSEKMPPIQASAITTQPVEIAKFESFPFSVIAAKTMKPSQNLYTETILWTLGEQFGDKSDSSSSAAKGIGIVKSFLKQIGIADDGIRQYDGSGLSRHNLITPAAAVRLYEYMAKQSPNALAWLNSLTIAGVDGTLIKRFKGTRAEGNMRGKTGTIDQVSALSGYVTTSGGERLALSIVVNGVPVTANRTSAIDAIVVALANFDGRSQ